MFTSFPLRDTLSRDVYRSIAGIDWKRSVKPPTDSEASPLRHRAMMNGGLVISWLRQVMVIKARFVRQRRMPPISPARRRRGRERGWRVVSARAGCQVNHQKGGGKIDGSSLDTKCEHGSWCRIPFLNWSLEANQLLRGGKSTREVKGLCL